MRISFCGDDRAKIRHNTREFVSANVDKNRIQDNIVIVNQTVQEAYENLFGEPLREYNDKQKRKDRKIDNYYTHLFGDVPESRQDEIQTNKNNQHSFWENILQVGDKDSAGILTNPKNARIATECLKEYIEGFQERNPYLYVFSAIIHLDEQTPHAHLDYIPFAEGYKKGLSRQLSIAKALELMGYSKNCDEAIRDFTANERKIFREICEQHGLEIEREEKGRGISFTPQQMRDGISKLYSELTETEKKLQETEKSLQEKQTSLQETEKTLQEKTFSVQETDKVLQEKQSSLSEVTAQEQTGTATVNALRKEKQKLQKTIDEDVEFIKSYTPSPTKKVKDFLGREKEVAKTVDELKDEKRIMTANELLARSDKIISEAKEEARLIVSSAEATAQKIISEAENSEPVLKAKAEAEQVIQSANSVLHEAEITRESADDYYKERVALADEEAEERSRQLDEREAHINTLSELSRPTAEYEERMQWLYDMPVRKKVKELLEEVDEPEEELDFDEEEIEEPDHYYDYEF
ncbi:MAG: plasmid recombination protein [Ruminococcus sp.]|nr:plasmid recombination protein [Ruminococcus sp.]